jgi:nitrogen fixation NifU-like protein
MYSAAVLQRFHEPKRSGELNGATHVGVAGVPGDGPYLRLFLQVLDNRVTQASFETYGCPAAVACGDLIAELAVGRDVSRLSTITPNDIMLILGGLPEGKEHCAEMAVTALKCALQGDDDGIQIPV